MAVELTPIDEAIERFLDEAADAAVNGESDKLKRLEDKIEDLKNRKDFGEIYYIEM